MNPIDELLVSFGEKVKEKRKSMGLTQEELAEKIHIGKRQIQRIEGGEADLHFSTFNILCDYLDISIESVFFPEMPEDDSEFLRIRAMTSACTPEDRRIILKTMDYLTKQLLKRGE